MRAEGWHHEQSWPSSCVPACMCMIQRWRGERATEEAFHDPATTAGSGLHLARSLPGTRSLPLYGTEDIRLSLNTDEIVVAVVHGPPYVLWQRRVYPDLQSRHGPLCPPGSYGGPLHAIVLARDDAGQFDVLDPYFPNAAQPLRMTHDDFERCFAGHAVAAEGGAGPDPHAGARLC